jgi:hypothetical protein
MIFHAIFPENVQVAQVNLALVALPGCLLARFSPCKVVACKVVAQKKKIRVLCVQGWNLGTSMLHPTPGSCV